MERASGAVLGARMAVRAPKRLLRLRSDARLVELVRAGDDAAFEVLYERHVAGILGFCRHMLGSQEEAEDAVQHTFVAAHRDIQRSRRELALKPWLYTVARNRCLSILRARREQPSEEIEISTAGLQHDVEKRADARELLADVGRLPEDQRAALVLTELGDLSHEEVATVLDCRAAAVKGIVFRARSALMERRAARDADCGDIREELALATGGALRRSRLRYHLESCPGCVAYLEEVRRQRKLLGVALPVVPTLALHDSVMASVGIGAGAAGAAGAAAAGGATAAGAGSSALGLGSSALGGTVAKVAIAGALVGGAGVATEAVVDRDGGRAPAVAPAGAGTAAPDRSDDASTGEPGAGERGAQRSSERSKGRRGELRSQRGKRRGKGRRGRPAAGRGRGRGRGRAGAPPGQARGGNPGSGVGPTGPPPSARPAPSPPPAAAPKPKPQPQPPPASSTDPGSGTGGPPSHARGGTSAQGGPPKAPPGLSR